MKIENAANTEPLYWTFEALSQMDEGDHYNHIKRLRAYYYNVLTDVSPDEAKAAKLDLSLLNQEIEDMERYSDSLHKGNYGYCTRAKNCYDG